MMKKFVLLFSIVMTVLQVQAQYNEDVSNLRPSYNVPDVPEEEKDTTSDVVVTPESHTNDKVVKLYDALAEYYESIDNIYGYRIQLYSGSNESVAKSIITKFKMKYGTEKYSTYIKYESPMFKVKVGDFISRLEVFRLYHELMHDFTSSLQVPDDKVDFDKLK